MAEFFALDALTAPNPTERQWIIRCAAELIVKRMFDYDDNNCPETAKMAAILAASQLATDAPRYLANLTYLGWSRLAVDIYVCVRWARAEKWEF